LELQGKAEHDAGLRSSGTVVDETGRRMDQAATKSRGFFGHLSSGAQKATGFVGSLGSGFLRLATPVGLVGTGLTALGGFLGGSFVNAASEAESVTAQLDAVLASTAGKAGVTREAALKLADSLSAKSGLSKYTDEAVLGAQNMLLTFTNIKDDVFPDATRTVLDMSQALGQDLKASSVQLGKALNDPIKGITALSRVGVTFTDQQKDQIETLVKSGKTMEAQKIILQELATEFGGSAKAAADTFSGRLNTVKERVGDVGERIGNALMPMLEGFVGWLSGPEVGAAIDVIAEGLINGIGKGWEFISGLGKGGWEFIEGAIRFLGGSGDTGTAISNIGNALGGALKTGWEWIQNAGAAGWFLIENALRFLGGSEDTGQAIRNIGGALVEALKTGWQWIEGAAAGGWSFIEAAIRFLGGSQDTPTAISNIGNALGGALKTGWEWIQNGAAGIWSVIEGAIRFLGGSQDTATAITNIGNALGGALKTGWEFLVGLGEGIWNTIRGALEFMRGFDANKPKDIGGGLSEMGKKAEEVAPWIERLTMAFHALALTQFATIALGLGALTAAMIPFAIAADSVVTVVTALGDPDKRGKLLELAQTLGVPLANALTLVAAAGAPMFIAAGLIVEGIEAVWTTVTGKGQQIIDFFQKLAIVVAPVQGIFATAMGGMKSEVASGVSALDANTGLMDTILNRTKGNMRTFAAETPGIGGAIPGGLAGGINGAMALATTAASTLAGNVRTEVAKADDNAHSIGEGVGSGLAGGIRSMYQTVYNAAYSLARQAKIAAENALESKSPSKIFYRIGDDIVVGLAYGVTENAHKAGQAVVDMVDNVIIGRAKNRLKNLPEEDLREIREAGAVAAREWGYGFDPTAIVCDPIVDATNDAMDCFAGSGAGAAQAWIDGFNDRMATGVVTVGQVVSGPGVPLVGGPWTGGHRPVQPMAKGGAGWVDRPTLFLAGEAGREFVSFTPEKGGGGGGVTNVYNPVYIDGQTIEDGDLHNKLYKERKHRSRRTGGPKAGRGGTH
jgi:hypothetical protein